MKLLYRIAFVVIILMFIQIDSYAQRELTGQFIMEFPNAFTPNPQGSSDGRYDMVDMNNDIFHPTWRGVVEFKMVIYNRRGYLLFETEDINIGWDGYYEKKLCPQGGYFYRAGGRFDNGQYFQNTGEVILLHMN